MKTRDIEVESGEDSLVVIITCPTKTEYLKHWDAEGFLVRALVASNEEWLRGNLPEKGDLGYVLAKTERYQLDKLNRQLFDIFGDILNLAHEDRPDVRAIFYNRATRELEKLKTYVDEEALRRSKA